MIDPKAVMYEEGRRQAIDLQKRSSDMTGSELNAEDALLPEFRRAREIQNMLHRSIGFVCKSSAGRVVRLLQPYDSNIYPQEPEDLSAQWGFVWSQDPAKARPFMSISTSPYMTGDCCLDGQSVFRSLQDNNVWSPSVYPSGWELIK